MPAPSELDRAIQAVAEADNACAVLTSSLGRTLGELNADPTHPDDPGAQARYRRATLMVGVGYALLGRARTELEEIQARTPPLLQVARWAQ